MSKRDKLIAKLRSNSKNMTWSELVTAMNYLGYELISKGSSHFDFYNSERDSKIKEIVKPHGGQKTVKIVYLKKINQLTK